MILKWVHFYRIGQGNYRRRKWTRSNWSFVNRLRSTDCREHYQFATYLYSHIPRIMWEESGRATIFNQTGIFGGFFTNYFVDLCGFTTSNLVIRFQNVKNLNFIGWHNPGNLEVYSCPGWGINGVLNVFT